MGAVVRGTGSDRPNRGVKGDPGDAQGISGSLADQEQTKLQLCNSGTIKRSSKGSRTRFKWEPPLEGGLNRTISVEVRLPAYLVAGLRSEGDLSELLRIAGRDLLIKRGITWWYPRFRAALAARDIER